MNLLQLYPENTYLTGMVSQCLSEIYIARTSHTLEYCTDRVSSVKNKPVYKSILLMINQIGMTELKNMNLFFLDKYHDSTNPDEYICYAYIQACRAFGLVKKAKNLENLYRVNFPNGQFIDQIQKSQN